jgi:hypothetical protein
MIAYQSLFLKRKQRANNMDFSNKAFQLVFTAKRYEEDPEIVFLTSAEQSRLRVRDLSIEISFYAIMNR